MVCLAKSIAGGLPMGAVLLGERLGEMPTGSHGSTFGGGPLVCAAALANLEVIESQGLPERAALLGADLRANLEEIDSPLVREVRGLGLMIGIEIRQKVAPYLASLAERGVLALPAGLTVLRLLPPLVIEPEQLERVVAALADVLGE
jgi:acetylornithine/LysW-gamma-L-lysine aminotransferase